MANYVPQLRTSDIFYLQPLVRLKAGARNVSRLLAVRTVGRMLSLHNHDAASSLRCRLQ